MKSKPKPENNLICGNCWHKGLTERADEEYSCPKCNWHGIVVDDVNL